MVSQLRVERLVIDAHYPRSVPWATIAPDDRLKLAVNRYTDPSSHSPTAPVGERLNFVFAHGNGFCKEAFEYTIELLFDKFGSVLGEVVAFDAANHCDSWVLNRDKVGWVASWYDFGRDIIRVVRELDFKGPTILYGHSMGATASLLAVHLEPGLFDSVVAIEPVCLESNDLTYAKLLGERIRRQRRTMVDEFKSEADYNKFMTQRSMYASFHPRVLASTIRAYGLKNADGTVTFKTPATQQQACYTSSGYAIRGIKELMKTIDCEVLHIASTAPGFLPPGTNEFARAALKYVTTADVEVGNHLVPYQHPEEVFAPAVPFIQKRYKRALEDIANGKNLSKLNPEQREKMRVAGIAAIEESFPLNDLYAKL